MADAVSLLGFRRPGALGCAGATTPWPLHAEARSGDERAHRDRLGRRPATFEYRRWQHDGQDVEAVLARGAAPSWTEFHDTFTVCTVERGPAVSWAAGGRRFARSPGIGMLVGPGDLQVDRGAPGDADYRVLRFAPALIESAARALGMPATHPVVVQNELTDPAENELFLSLHRALDEGRDQAVLHEVTNACIDALVRHCAAGPHVPLERDGVLRAREHIRRHLAERLTLEGLANEVGMGKWGLVSLFRRHVGVPPLRYVLHMRIARARVLLGGGHPPCAVAAEVGFFDQSHLHRWFRRTYGVAPGEYQRAVAPR